MKKIVLLLGLIVSTGVTAQITGLGIQPKINFSSQLFIDQNVKLKHGIYGTDYMSSAGFDVFTDYKIGERFKLRGKLGIESKGYANKGIAIYGNSISHNIYRYVSLDLGLTYDVFKWDNMALYVTGGLSNGYVFSRIRSVESAHSLIPPALNSEYDAYNLGGIIAIGYNVGDVMWLEAEWNRDILAPLNSQQLKVYNSVYSVNVGVNLLKFFKKKKTA